METLLLNPLLTYLLTYLLTLKVEGKPNLMPVEKVDQTNQPKMIFLKTEHDLGQVFWQYKNSLNTGKQRICDANLQKKSRSKVLTAQS